MTGPGPGPAPRLTEPSLLQHRSFLDALEEHRREGLHTDLHGDLLQDPVVFAQWLRRLDEDGRVGRADEPRDRVPHRVLWWTQDDAYLGRLRLNLELTDGLREFGGHLGYDVRPSARGRGHATAMLAAALRRAAVHGISEVLLTCGPENAASRRVIERNGGALVDVSAAGRLRFSARTS